MHKLKLWRELYLIESEHPLHKLWSIRIALLWGAVAGLYSALPAIQDYVTPLVFGLLNVSFSVALVIARITKQSKE